jgi:hypothetical protein
LVAVNVFGRFRIHVPCIVHFTRWSGTCLCVEIVVWVRFLPDLQVLALNSGAPIMHPDLQVLALNSGAPIMHPVLEAAASRRDIVVVSGMQPIRRGHWHPEG